MPTKKKASTKTTGRKSSAKKVSTPKIVNKKITKKVKPKSVIGCILFTEIPVTYGIITVLLILLIGFFIIMSLQ